MTRVGNRNFIMAYSHIGHDCNQRGKRCANGQCSRTLGGHVHVADFAIVSGLVAVHSSAGFGRFAMVSGLTGVPQDIPLRHGRAYGGKQGHPPWSQYRGPQKTWFFQRGYCHVEEGLPFSFQIGALSGNGRPEDRGRTGRRARPRLVTFVRSSERGICR